MRNIFGKLGAQLSRLLYGKYGIDGLTLPLTILSCGVTLIASLTRIWWLRTLGTLILLWAIFRIFSKNHEARRKELRFYLTKKQKLTEKIQLLKNIWQNRKTKKYFKCPACNAYLFVPKGKGKIKISCKKCGHQFVRKT